MTPLKKKHVFIFNIIQIQWYKNIEILSSCMQTN